MLSGQRRHCHFSAKYSADMHDQFCTHCRTPSIIRQTCPAASNIWRALSRLAHPTSKKGTSIATSAHFAAIRGILCVQCFRVISPPTYSPNQNSDRHKANCKGCRPRQIKARGSFHFYAFHNGQPQKESFILSHEDFFRTH
ncbi:Uncharacterised protein [Salmonella enterica subsp. enterica serovar Bovismorbificans]|uniref:Uncharacterized protein n=1 Tax=Salmonella enterica subsp. enterica serovar Bovismorbificans TaxID=58097 RepID=A0A655BM74_SALET|nr:Uncharacterised protein [Salmonella enterica subsp. enterica serovar Bovismorbificans]